MRKHSQKAISELLDTMEEIHGILESSQTADIPEYLSGLEEAAAQIFRTLEHELPQEHDALAGIQKYADSVNQILTSITDSTIIALPETGRTDLPASSHTDAFAENPFWQISQNLNDQLNNVRKSVLAEPVIWRCVFFPYKAEMWDSLESIWRAMDSRPEFECTVVPIPYFTKDKENDHWEDHYDGARYPEDVPVTDWINYDIENDAPDVAFIHNPYDNHNHVVSVHPKYYSSELKKSVGLLFYVPYYVTSGFFSITHMHLPVYEHMDYMIAQSQHFCDIAAKESYHEKMLPLGSPKVDRVIYRMRQPDLVPPEWQTRLKSGKRSVMLNSSIHAFLDSGGVYMKKIRAIMKFVEAQNDIVLIWRPHPLLMATMKAMRPELSETLRILITEAEEKGCLIFDDTPDISRTVAIADAYIGESATSVINLFMAAGKPVFILNNSMRESFSDHEKWRIPINGLLHVENRLLLTSGHGLYELHPETNSISLSSRVTDQHHWAGDFGEAAYLDGWLYPAPSAAHAPVRFHVSTCRAENLFGKNGEKQMAIIKTIACGSYIVYLPAEMQEDLTAPILVYDTESNRFFQIDEPMPAMTHGSLPTVELVRDAAVLHDKIYLTATYTNQILELDISGGRFELKQPAWKETEKQKIDEHRTAPLGYSCIESDGQYLWLAEAATGDLVRWEPDSNDTLVFPMPAFFTPYKSVNLRWIAHQRIAVTPRYVLTCPGYANLAVCLNRETGEITPLTPEFWISTTTSHNGYEPERDVAGITVIATDDDTVVFQRAYDLAAIRYHISSGIAEDEYYYQLDREARRELMSNIDGTPFDGFEMIQKDNGFFCCENRNYSLEDFLSWLQTADLKAFADKERGMLTWLTETLDGTCGEKTADAVLKILQEDML